MRRARLLTILSAVLVGVLCSSAMGAFRLMKLNAQQFAFICALYPASEIRAALEAGADMDERALINAANSNADVEVMNLLISEVKKSGMDIAKMNIGGQMLCCAVLNNKNPLVVKAILDEGVDANYRIRYWDKVMSAIELARSERNILFGPYPADREKAERSREEIIIFLKAAGARE